MILEFRVILAAAAIAVPDDDTAVLPFISNRPKLIWSEMVFQNCIMNIDGALWHAWG